MSRDSKTILFIEKAQEKPGVLEDIKNIKHRFYHSFTSEKDMRIFNSKKNYYEIGYASMWRHDDNEKVIVAVPGVDIEEIIQVITREGKL